MAVWELVQPKLWRVVCVMWERGEGAETQDPLDARYGCVRGDHRSEHRFEACGDTIAGKGGVEAGIKPSKGVGAAAAAVIERQLNGFMGSWAGVGTPAGRQSAQTHH